MTIQSEAEEKKILQTIVATSEEFLQAAGKELNYQKINDNILDISGAQYAAFNLYEEDGRNYRTVISRIILIVDAYDVMTSGRVYKPAIGSDEAIAELKRCAGSLFDPALVDKFIEILAKK
jgi:hypothetical protein